jgi:hypothetical protein
VAVVIWYEVPYAVNLVSKQMQAKNMLIDVAIEKCKGLFLSSRAIGKLVS